jgi:restriction endonuclease S subunit
MTEWRQVRIGDFLHRAKSPVSLRDDEEYQLVTVRMHHNGVTLREKKKGKLIGSNMYRVKTGQFILSGIDARNGAFGVIPEDLDGAIVTNDFWYFDIDDAVVSRDFFLWLSTTPLFLDACIKSSEGTTNRRRLQAERFFNFSFNFPGVSEQHRLAERFIAFDKTYSALKEEFETQTTHFKQLRQAVLQEAVEGKLTADWRRENVETQNFASLHGNPLYNASALLAKIKAEKERLVKAGTIRKEKPLPPIADSDKIELPYGWACCRIDEILSNSKSALKAGPFGSALRKDSYVQSGYKVYGQEQVIKQDPFWGTYYINDKKFESLKSCEVAPGDILLSLVGTIGKVLILPDDIEPGIINPRLIKISLFANVSRQFFSRLFSSVMVQRQLKDLASGQTMDVINIGILKKLIFPLPPSPNNKPLSPESTASWPPSPHWKRRG